MANASWDTWRATWTPPVRCVASAPRPCLAPRSRRALASPRRAPRSAPLTAQLSRNRPPARPLSPRRRLGGLPGDDPNYGEKPEAGPGGYETSGLNAVAPMLGNLGYGAIILGFCAMTFATAYFLSAATHSHSKASRIYHYITLVVTFCESGEASGAAPRGAA